MLFLKKKVFMLIEKNQHSFEIILSFILSCHCISFLLFILFPSFLFLVLFTSG